MRKLACFALFFAAGILLSVYLLSGIISWVCIALCAAAIPFFLLFGGKTRLRWLLSWIGLLAGLVYFMAYSTVFLAPLLTLDGQSAGFTATVVGYSESAGSKTAIDAKLHGSGLPACLVQIQAEAEETEQLQPGDRIQVHGSLTSAISKGSYSYGRVLTVQADSVACIGRTFPGIRGLGAIAAEHVKTTIARCFSESVSPLAIAMVTGDKTAFNNSDDLSRTFQIAGLSHIVAVSGLHITYVLAIPALLVRNRRRYACVAAPLVLCFMAFAGFTSSVCRAGLMCLVLCVSFLFRRRPDTLTSLSAALMVLLAADPYSAASISLQLSFSSVLGIVLLSGRLRDTLLQPLAHWGSRARRLADFPISALSVSLGALSATVPLSAIYFGRISLVAPLVAVLTFGILTLAFLLTVAAALLGLIALPAGAAAALPAGLLLRLIQWIARVFSGFRFSAIYTENPLTIIWILAAYVILLTLLAAKAPLRRWLIPCCLLAAALCAVLLLPEMIPQKGLMVTALDVGQGQCLILRSGTATAVVDCGSSSDSQAGEELLSYLRSKGYDRVDILLLTHYHADHCNGIPTLLKEMKVGAMVLPPDDDQVSWDESIREIALDSGIRTYTVADEVVTIGFGEAEAKIYPSLAGESENERCPAIVCSSGDFDVVITGDMPAICEVQLTEYADLPDAEVLVVGHHGSSSSTSEELLSAVTPEIALISVGENSYGHPTDEVLAKLTQYGAAVFRTDTMGTITITSEAEAADG